MPTTSSIFARLPFVLLLSLPLPSPAMKSSTAPGSTTAAPTATAASAQKLEPAGAYAGHTWYQMFGSGRPVLIINGGPGLDSAGFAGIAQALAAAGFQAIIYDQRGTGHSKISEINADTMKLSLMVDDIEQLRSHLGMPRLTILGHSFGGVLAASYAARYPQHVEQLILSSSAGLNLQFREQFAARFDANLSVSQRASLLTYRARQAAGEQSDTLRAEQAEIMANAYVVDKSHAPAVAARLKVVNMRINQLVHDDLTRQNYDLTKAFAQFQAPVLVIQGEQDVIAPSVGQAAAAAFPHAQLTLLPNSGHYGWLDQPKLFYRTLLGFLNPPSAEAGQAALSKAGVEKHR